MLATRLEDPRRLADPRYSAEPKLDGQRAQLHVRDHRTIHAFSRPGRECCAARSVTHARRTLPETRLPIAVHVRPLRAS
jgi:ATP-dependent DNA ligase